MAPKRRNRKSAKRVCPTSTHAATFATSSPLRNSSVITEEEEEMVQAYKRFENEIEMEFNTLLNSMDEEILNLPFEETMRCILSELENDERGEIAEESKKKINNTIGVFKTPKLKETASSSKSRNLNPNSTSYPEPYAVVTPGPRMNRTVKMMRVPLAGETAVSLAGSPLLVTPFPSNNDHQVTLAVADKTGKIMAVQSEHLSVSDDEDLVAALSDEAKEKIKNMALYLSKISNKL